MESENPHDASPAIPSSSPPQAGAPSATAQPLHEPPEAPPAWTLLVLFTLLAVPAMIGFAIFGPRALDGANAVSALVRALIASQLAFLLTALAWARLCGLRVLPLLRLTGPSWTSLLLGVGSAFAALLAGYGLNNVVLTFLPTSFQSVPNPLAPLANSALDPWLRFALLSILPGLCEELFFRGALQTALLRGRSPGRAILIGAIIFAACHFDFVRFPVRLVAGLTLGWLAWRTGSLWPGVVAHALLNGPAEQVVVALIGPAARLQTAASSSVALAVGLFFFTLLALAARRWLPPAPAASSFLVRRYSSGQAATPDSTTAGAALSP